MLTLIIIYYARKYGLFSLINKLTAQLIRSYAFIHVISAILLLAVFPAIAVAQKQSQEHCYIIKRGNDSIGRLKTRQSAEGNQTINILDSKVQVSLLIDFKINESIIDVYKNNELYTALAIRTINGHQKLYSSALRSDNGYKLKKKDEEDTNLSGIIYHSVSSLYFDEPDQYTTVFSEAFQQNIMLKKVEPHKYLLETPNGNKTYYCYNNGILIKVEAETSWSNITLELENPLANK